MDILLISLLSLIQVPVAIFTTGPFRIGLGLALALFFPGYTLIAALFPRRRDLNGIERLALSLGLSMAVVPLIGLALNYTPWGIRVHSILIALSVFIMVMATIAWYRRRRLTPEGRFAVHLRPYLSSLTHSWLRQSRWDRVLTILLILTIGSAIGTLTYVVVRPKVGERFTEFYILGPEGQAEGYPQELDRGAEARIILGVINHEGEATAYKAEITLAGETVAQIAPITLGHGERWEREVGFAPLKAGPNQKAEFLLYKANSDDPYRSLHLWISVQGP